MSLWIEMRFGEQPLARGTAFVVEGPRGPLLITNRHNVTGRHQDTGTPLCPMGGIPDNLIVMHNRKGALGTWIARSEDLYVNDTPRWVEHPSLGPQADFVALPLTNLADTDLFPYDPANPGPPIAFGPTDIVSVVGFPFGMTSGGGLALWATGFVASEPTVPEPTFLIDCRSRQGQSGSAVIAYRAGGMITMETGDMTVGGGPQWRFLGIYSGRINPESDLGIVWKSSAIAELVASA